MLTGKIPSTDTFHAVKLPTPVETKLNISDYKTEYKWFKEKWFKENFYNSIQFYLLENDFFKKIKSAPERFVT